MKKSIAIIVLCALLSCAVLPLTVSAAGSVLFKETFDSQVDTNWLWDGTLFYVENGELRGWSEARVHQSFFPTKLGGMIKYKECAWKTDCIAYDDGGIGAETHQLGLWFADYIDPYGTDEPDSWIIYKPLYNFEDHELLLEMEFTGDSAEPFRPEDFPTDAVVARYKIPESEAQDVGGDWFSIGMRCVNGVVSLFYNDIKLVDFPAYRGTTSFTQRPSPIILLNGECYCAFDNVTVSTPDYDLFNEGAAAATPADNTPSGGEPANEPEPTEKVVETKVETKVVEDTDENGEIVTRIETEIVTEEVVRPAPDTAGAGNQGSGGGTSARTGDAAIVVIAVMIAALGAAIVVKKVSTE